MDIHLRKIQLVQSILNIQDEQIIIGFERFLEKLRDGKNKEEIIPMSVEELNERINKSENDFYNEKFKEADTLLAKYL